MPRPSPEARELAEQFVLAPEERVRRGPLGEQLGRGTGSSLEFQDRRDYFPGDDVRHLDWRAYARTDQLMVRQYQEEVLPRVELLLDTSASMASDSDKAQRALDLAYIVAAAAEASGCEVRLIAIGEEPLPSPWRRLDEEDFEFDCVTPLDETVRRTVPRLRQGTRVVWLSDFLAPVRAEALVGPLARRAARLTCLQVLSAFDAEPKAGAALRLTDAETAEAIDLWLDAASVERYRKRLEQWDALLRTECRRASAGFVSVRADTPLAELCRSQLTRERLLEPR